MNKWNEIVLQRERDNGEIEFYFEPYHVIKDANSDQFDYALNKLTDALEQAKPNDPNWDEHCHDEIEILLQHLVFMQWKNNKPFTEDELSQKYLEIIMGNLLKRMEESGLVESIIDDNGEIKYKVSDDLKNIIQ